MIISNPTDYQDGKAVSFSWLKRLEADPEMYYRRFVLGEKPDADDEEDESRALKVGTAAHCLILEGPVAFAERFVTHPETYEAKGGEAKRWNRNAAICGQWEDAQEASGRKVVKPADFNMLAKMRTSLAKNPDALRLLSSGQAEHAIRQAGGSLGFDIQGRLDWLNLDERAVIDVKTIQRFPDRKRDFEQRRYYAQMAHYCDLAALEYPAGADFSAHIIWLEKEWPYRCAVETLCDDYLALGRKENTEALLKLAEFYAGAKPWPRTPDHAVIQPSAELLWRMMEAECGA